jgi:hypothetical protein
LKSPPTPGKANYQKFALLEEQSISQVYNLHKAEESKKMVRLPGNPLVEHFLVHCKGLLSSNDHSLGPDGTPFLSINDLLSSLHVHFRDWEGNPPDNLDEISWLEYSNTNYAVLVPLINLLWDGSIENFMQDTLFRPFKMDSTTLCEPSTNADYAKSYVVTKDRKLYLHNSPKYTPDSPLLLAMGGYSSANDLARFLLQLLRIYYHNPKEREIPGVDADFVAGLLELYNEDRDNFTYTPRGVLTHLNETGIGCLSMNRRKVPDHKLHEPICTDDSEVYYMAGSAVGSSCCYALLPGKGEVVIVLANTSGTVDVADIILRIVLRKLYGDRDWAREMRSIVPDFWTRAKAVDEEMMKHEADKKATDERSSLNITGNFTSKTYNQNLLVEAAEDGRFKVRVEGSKGQSRWFELIWIGPDSLRICVPPYLTLDCFKPGDWSQLTLTVHTEGNTVVQLDRQKSKTKKIEYTRSSGRDGRAQTLNI